MKLTYTVAEERPEQAAGLSLTVLQEEEVQEIADFEKNWELNSLNSKPSALSIEENNTFMG
jgi:ATP-dependent RNA helicase DeaD